MSRRKPYPNDLSDARWALIEPTLTAWRKARLDRRPTGQPAKVELRDVFNAILCTGFKNAVIEHGARLGIDVEVVNRNPEKRGFHVVKRRWVVERSIGWIMMHRRLARDYETIPASSEAMIHVASIDNLAKRITDETTPTWRGTY